MNAGAVPGLEWPLAVTFCAPGDSSSQLLGREQRRGTRELTNFVTLDERAQARDTVMQTAPKNGRGSGLSSLIPAPSEQGDRRVLTPAAA